MKNHNELLEDQVQGEGCLVQGAPFQMPKEVPLFMGLANSGRQPSLVPASSYSYLFLEVSFAL